MSSKFTKRINGRYCDWRYRQLLSAYLDNELGKNAGTKLKLHLKKCPYCCARYEDMRFASRIANQMSIPDERPAGLPLSMRKRFIQNRTPQTKRRTLILAPLAAILLIFGSLTLWYYTESSSKPSWEVSSLDGSPQIGTVYISNSGNFEVGDWLETDSTSRARIEVADIGHVELEPNSRLNFVETRPTEHRLALERGRMHARIWAPPRLFFVDTPSATAVDYGCAYTLEVEDSGNSLLHVTEGWVALELNDRKSLVPAGAYCETRKGIGPGTPYFEGTSEAFRNALSKLDFENGDFQALNVVLSEARQRDALTLWHLLARLDLNKRDSIYQHLAALVSPPEEVTRDGILKLDRQMLDSWREKINAAPGSLSTADGVLAAVGNMMSPRAAHTATLLPDNRILIAGGMIQEGTFLESAEIYDPNKQSFEPTGSMSVKRTSHTATRLPDGRVLIAGGFAEKQPTATAEIYDPAAGSFSPAGSMTTERVSHQATLLPDGKVLITGGQNSKKNKLSSAEIYDPKTGIFTLAGRMTTPRIDHTSTLLQNGKVLITGGSVGNYPKETVFSSAELYNPQSGEFIPTGGMTSVRYKHAAALLPDGRVLVIGGSDARVWQGRYSSAEIYDPAAGTFTQTKSMGAARFKMREAVLPMANGKILVAGGGERLEVYDPSAGTFSRVGNNTGTESFYSTATLLSDGTVLITGGIGQSVTQEATRKAWIYQP